MKIQGTDWYTAYIPAHFKELDQEDGVGTLCPAFCTYRYSLAGMTDDEIQKESDQLQAKGIEVIQKISKQDHTGIPAGTPFFQVKNKESVENFEKKVLIPDLKQQGLELNPHRFDEYIPLDFKCERDWDRVSTAGGQKGLRINLNRLSVEDENELIQRLKTLGVSEEHLAKAQRIASVDSEHCFKGDRTLRIMWPADLERLTTLFDLTERPDARWEWRNFNNWTTKDVVGLDGKPHVNMAFNMDNLSEEKKKRVQDVLGDLGIEYSLNKFDKTKDAPHYLCVTGAKNIEALKDFTKPWSWGRNNRKEKDR